jgi:GNAT superfamily N-acetyltransferase
VAYQIGVAEEPYSRFATWVGWPASRPESVVVFYEIDEPALVFCAGRAEGTRAILEAAGQLPSELYAVCPHEHLPAFERWYRFERPIEMQRMALPSGADVPEPELSAEQLKPEHLPEILSLLRSEGMRLDPVQLHGGRYFGVRHHGELVSVAAAHFVSRRRGMAFIGNIVTRPDRRGRGFARAAMLRLIHELRPLAPAICLDVNVANEGAAKLYETLGFAPRSRHLEGLGRMAI